MKTYTAYYRNYRLQNKHRTSLSSCLDSGWACCMGSNSDTAIAVPSKVLPSKLYTFSCKLFENIQRKYILLHGRRTTCHGRRMCCRGVIGGSIGRTIITAISSGTRTSTKSDRTTRTGEKKIKFVEQTRTVLR